MIEAQLGGPGRIETAQILHEGWVDKLSRHLGRWRRRWNILFVDRHSGYPALCSFKHERCEWDPLASPIATERITPLIRACVAPPDYVEVGRPHIFCVQVCATHHPRHGPAVFN